MANVVSTKEATAVPFNDLNVRIAQHRDGLDAAYREVMDSGWLVLGRNVTQFEEEFASYIGVEECVGVGNGTDALELALRAVGVEPGSTVATAANAGGYSSTAIRSIGARPLFVDVHSRTHTVTSETMHTALEAGIDAVVITHLYGQLAPDTSEIVDLCARYEVPVVEDCAQAHGAHIAGQMAGSFGDIAAFSFYPTKNLGAIGDGGAVCTTNDRASTVRTLRQYGWSAKYTTDTVGGRNSRLDELQAAFLRRLLSHLDDDNAERVRIAHRYIDGMDNPHIELPDISAPDHVAHLFVCQTDDRDALREHLSACSVSTDVHYPIPDHKQGIFDGQLAWPLPTSELLASRVLSLPCYPGLSKDAIDHVIASVNAFEPNGDPK